MSWPDSDCDDSYAAQDKTARLQAGGTGTHHLPSNVAAEFVSLLFGFVRGMRSATGVEGLARLCGWLRFGRRAEKVFVSST